MLRELRKDKGINPGMEGTSLPRDDVQTCLEQVSSEVYASGQMGRVCASVRSVRAPD